MRFGNEGAKPLVFPPQGSQPRSARITAPLHGATPPGGLRARQCASARRARREARVPAGQFKNAAPPGARSAGRSASFSNSRSTLNCSRSSPGWAGTTGPVREADRAGRPQGQPLQNTDLLAITLLLMRLPSMTSMAISWWSMIPIQQRQMHDLIGRHETRCGLKPP